MAEDQDTEAGPGAPRVPLDQLGRVPPPTVTGLVLAPGLPEASRARLQSLGGEDGGVEITDDLERAADARLVVLSTRVPRAELTAALARIAEASTCPVVALVHPGGESQSVDLVRRGAVAVLAEGNEPVVAALLMGEGGTDAALLDSYDRHVARADTATHGSRGRDPGTGLPDRASWDARLAGLEQEGEVPRLVLVEVVRAPMVPDELGEDAAAFVRRRLATQFLHVGRVHACEVFALDRWRFGLVAASLSPNGVEGLARDLERIAETYSPTGVRTLGVAVGHAGPEVSTDLGSLRESAQRALDAAMNDRTVLVVGADALSLGVSATTELEAALQVVDHVRRQSGRPADAFARTGDVAATLATALGYDGLARSRIQLAAHLHAIGAASLPAESLRDPDALTGEELQAYRQYPLRSAAYLAPTAGPEVAAAVRAHRERWDGAGFPDGLAGPSIPVAARVVTLAIAVADLVHPDLALDRDAVVGALESRAGVDLDPDLVPVAVELLDELLASSMPVPA